MASVRSGHPEALHQRHGTPFDDQRPPSQLSGDSNTNEEDESTAEEEMSKGKGRKPSAFQRFMMNFTSVLGLPVYKSQRARQLGKVPPPACFHDERLEDSPNASPSMLRRSYSVGSKERRKKGRKPRTWRRRKLYKWESSEDHHVSLEDTELSVLCEAEVRALQDLAVVKLGKRDFPIAANLVKVLNQLSNPRNKMQRRSFRRRAAADKDSGCVFGQPLSRVVYQDKALLARRMSSPYVVPYTSTPTPRAGGGATGENVSLHSIVSMSSNSVLGPDSPPSTPLPPTSTDHAPLPTPPSRPSAAAPRIKSLSSSRLHSEVTTLSPPPAQLLSPSHSQFAPFSFEGSDPQNSTISSAFSNMSLDNSTLLQSEFVDEPVQMSPETERKLLLTRSTPLVPNVIRKSVDYLQSKGMMMEGIFRVSGAKSRISKIRERFDRGASVGLTEDLNPHDVACLLKEYLRCLPEPLICKELYSLFLQTRKIESRSKRRDTLRLLCLLLPKPNRDTLHCLLHFLNQVALHSNDIIMMDGTEEQGNRMSEENLGMIMGPNILHKRKIAGQSDYAGYQKGEKDDIMAVSQVVEDLITMESSVFKVPAELLDEAIDRLIVSDPILADKLLRSKIKGGLDEDEDQSLLDVRFTGYSRETPTSSGRVPMHRSKSSDTLRYRTLDVGVGGPPPPRYKKHSEDVLPPPPQDLPAPLDLTSAGDCSGDGDGEVTTEVAMETRKSSECLFESVEAKPPPPRPEEVGGAGNEAPEDEGIHLALPDQLARTGPKSEKRTFSADASVYLKHPFDLGGESPLSSIHQRVNSESSNGSSAVNGFPGNCKNQGSDSAFSFTTGSRSSSEGIPLACDVPDGRLSAAGVHPHSKRPPQGDSPKYPHISREDNVGPVPPPAKPPAPGNKPSQEEMESLQVKFKELESKVAELDSQVSSLHRAPAFAHTSSQQRPSHFTDLDFQFEKLTSELSILDSLSQRSSVAATAQEDGLLQPRIAAAPPTHPREGAGLRTTPVYYHSLSSKHGLHHSILPPERRDPAPPQHPTKARKVSAPSPAGSSGPSPYSSPAVPPKSHSHSPDQTTRSRSRSSSASRTSKSKSPKHSPRPSVTSQDGGNSPHHDDPLLSKGISQHGPERMV